VLLLRADGAPSLLLSTFVVSALQTLCLMVELPLALSYSFTTERRSFFMKPVGPPFLAPQGSYLLLHIYLIITAPIADSSE
jgi:hypothetical protein